MTWQSQAIFYKHCERKAAVQRGK